MPGVFEGLFGSAPGQAVTAPGAPQSSGIWSNIMTGGMQGVVDQKQMEAFERERAGRDAQAAIMQKAAQYKQQNPQAPQAEIINHLIQDPDFLDTAGNMSQEELTKALGSAVSAVAPTPAMVPFQQNTAYGSQVPGAPPTPFAIGSTETPLRGRFGEVLGSTSTPPMIMEEGQWKPMGQAPGTPQPQAPGAQGPAGSPTGVPGIQTMPGPLDLGTSPFSSMIDPNATPNGLPGSRTGAADMNHLTWPEGAKQAVWDAEGTNGPAPYDVVLGYGRWGSPDKPLSTMTLREVRDFGMTMRQKQFAEGKPWEQTSSAAGAWQITGTNIERAQSALGLDDNVVYTGPVQDAIAKWIYEQQGFGAWEGFKNNPNMLRRAQYAISNPDAAFSPTQAGMSGTPYTTNAPSGFPQHYDETTPPSRPAPTGTELSAGKTYRNADDFIEQTPASVVFGSGINSTLLSYAGTTGRLLDPSLDIKGSRAASINKYRIGDINLAIDGLRTGRELKSTIQAVQALRPTGEGTDPLAAADNFLELHRVADNSISFWENRDRGAQSQAHHNEIMGQLDAWLNLKSKLPDVEGLTNVRDWIKQNPMSQSELVSPRGLAKTAGETIKGVTGYDPSKALGGGGEGPTGRGRRGAPPSAGVLDAQTAGAMSRAEALNWWTSSSKAAKEATPADVRSIIRRKFGAGGQ